VETRGIATEPEGRVERPADSEEPVDRLLAQNRIPTMGKESVAGPITE